MGIKQAHPSISVEPPRIDRLRSGCYEMIVKGKPFLILPAEINNSSMSCTRYMTECLPKLKAQGLNTILGSVGWNQVEPEEGRFEFGALRHAIEQARVHGLHLVILWFGSFKNGKSSYTPSWVKRDVKRFPRAKLAGSHQHLMSTEVLSVFESACWEADARVFEAMMRFVKSFDENEQTVIMVQVENEVGLLGDTRDRSELAGTAWSEPVPSILTQGLLNRWDELHTACQSNLGKAIDQTSTAWKDVCQTPDQSDELFMAYHYARYLEQVAKRGKSVYNIPMFANAWLRAETEETNGVSGGAKPGTYPCGGPVDTVLDVWQIVAPSLDFLGPDIYGPKHTEACQKFSHRGQPLFIPEQSIETGGAVRAWEALATYNALGCSPFAIDHTDDVKNAFPPHWELLNRIAPILLQARRDNLPMKGFYFDQFKRGEKDPQPSRVFEMGQWRLNVKRPHMIWDINAGYGAGYGMIMQTDPDTFLLIGAGYKVIFESLIEGTTFSGLDSVIEKDVVGTDEQGQAGTLKDLRWLNGDETRSNSEAVMPYALEDVHKDYKLFLESATTKILECKVYAIVD